MTQKRTMNKLLLTLVLSISTTSIFAQQTFKYKVAVQKVDSTAFYRIALSPELLAKCNPDMSDIRLIDQNSKYVPFIYGDQLPVKDESNFVAFPQVANAKQADSLTTIIIQNKLSLTINQLNLRLRNTSAERVFTLSGSDDLSGWYAIKENVLLSGIADYTHQSIYEQVINFPASNYRYFKISVNNSRKEPVNIIQVGIYLHQFVKPIFTELHGTNFYQKDTGRLSKVVIQLQDVYPVNKIHLTVAGAKYYRRSVSIYAISGKQHNLISDTLLSSAGTNNFFITTKAKIIELIIANDDNPPLSINAIDVFSLNQSVIGYLTKDQSYNLVFGDPLSKSPNYDLKFFADSLDRNLTLLNSGTVVANPLYQADKNKTDPQFPAWLIWVAIALVLAILALLTHKMTKEIGKKAYHE
ncbi:MAG: hypothetical protein JWR05_2087 [Mucilaginibacter sp.]|nr:hypothetical protein [Mucilaginibacter sp.]